MPDSASIGEEHTSGAEEAAEDTILSGKFRETPFSGAQAHRSLSAAYGTTEVVPCYKAAFFRSL
jgi:hypothetical protein